MQPFIHRAAETPRQAIAAFGQAGGADAIGSPVQYLAGGTTLVDLMKLDVMQPEKLVDINALANTPLGQVDVGRDGIRLGAALGYRHDAIVPSEISSIWARAAISPNAAGSAPVSHTWMPFASSSS